MSESGNVREGDEDGVDGPGGNNVGPIPPLILDGPGNRFISDGAAARYKKFGKKNITVERPFTEVVADYSPFREWMDERGIMRFIHVEGLTSWELAREFFANVGALEDEAKKTNGENAMNFKMRVVIVDFSSTAINRFLERRDIAAKLRQQHWENFEQLSYKNPKNEWDFVKELGIAQPTCYYNAHRTRSSCVQ